MFRKPFYTLILLIILAVIAALISLPENYRLNTTLFGRKIDTIINPIQLDATFLGITIKKSFKTQLGLDLAGGTHISLEADMKDVPQAERLDALESSKQVIERRVNFFGISEPVVQTAHSNDAYRIVVELPGITDAEQAVGLIGQTARLEFRELLNPDSTDAADMYPTLQNTKPTDISGKDLKKASLSFSSQNGAPEVAIEFTGDGAKKFSDLTTRLVGKRLPIFLDSVVLTWPTVSVAITDGSAVINGTFTTEEAKNLALQLNAGTLPVSVKVVEKRTVGASLGQQSINASIRAGAIGLTLVAIYMVLLYGWLGVIADMALIMYGLLTFALFRWIPITLTLPGVAGFFLSVGMAVDANILIFERYKEELRYGRSWKTAMELGFGKAWDSIRDANVTTIVTSLILYNPGNWNFLPTSGMVRGFAITLLLGVVISLFTGIVVTRTLIRVLYRSRDRRV